MQKIAKLASFMTIGILTFSIFLMTLSGCSGGHSNAAATNTSKAIMSFTIANPAVNGTINESAKTITLTVPHETNVTALVAIFATTGASVKVGIAVQASGTTANDFTNPVIYTVTAADGSTAQYTVTVTAAPDNAKAITSFFILGLAGNINESAKTIAVTVPYGTNVTALDATFATTGTSVTVGSALQISGTTANNFTSPVVYTVTAADGSTVQYTVTVTVGPNSAKAITGFSLLGAAGVINESSKTISVTVPNGTNVTALTASFDTTGASVRVGTAVQSSGVTANDFTSPVVYTVTAADGSTAQYTVTVTVASASAKAITSYSILGAAGMIDESAKTISVTVPYGTNVTALVASYSTLGKVVKVGSVVQTSGVTVNDFTIPIVYTVTAEDNSTAQYTVTVTVASTSAKAITSYSILGAPGIIDESAKTIAVTVPYGTNVNALVAIFATTGASVKIGSIVQTSGASVNDFTSPLVYTVTAADSSTAQYTTTVTVMNGPDYLPHAAGSTWTYTTYDPSSGLTYSHTSLITQSSSTSWSEADTDSTDPSSYDVIMLNLANGVWRLTQEMIYSGSSVNATFTYSPGEVMFPSNTSVGTHESYSSAVWSSLSGTVACPDTYSDNYTVVGFESVTVPAGTFNQALKITDDLTYTSFSPACTTFSQTTTTYTDWYVDGVGWVKEVDSEGGIKELTSYSIQ